jgi:hypothetical protein
MTLILITWLGSAALLTGLAWWLGKRVLRRGPTGILIDGRGRYSLSQFQVVVWSVVVLSLLSGLFVARFITGVPDALGFAIPDELLVVMGISLGGAAIAGAIKGGKDATHPERVAASSEGDPPRFAQMLLVEEGTLADQVVDVAKFQNFVLTIMLVVAYVLLVIGQINATPSVADVVLPGFGDGFLGLLGVSHAGYLAGKLPDRSGAPDGLSVAGLKARAVPIASVKPVQPQVMTYQPRNAAV